MLVYRLEEFSLYDLTFLQLPYPGIKAVLGNWRPSLDSSGLTTIILGYRNIRSFKATDVGQAPF